jgi:hypothetical protein
MKELKIGLLILSTSNKRDHWKNMKDTYFYNLTLKTFLLSQDKEHSYVFYIGIDAGDRIFDNPDQQNEVYKFSKVFKNVEFKFIKMDGIPKGHVTIMWNRLFKQAFDEMCDYFYQCGDDIYFKTNGWVNDCISTLNKNRDIGLTGPINNNPTILTQAFVSRKHMDIFGWFFPEQIVNWCCDDWYNIVYKPDNFFPLRQHYCSNDGGDPRYDIANKKNFKGNNMTTFKLNIDKLRNDTSIMANQHKNLIVKYVKK